MKQCQNAQPGTYGHECGKPAQWTATNRHGHTAGFCDQCKATGYEARTYSQWTPLQGAAAMKQSRFTARWNDYPDQPDPSMTRERAATLIRAWRRNTRKKTNSSPWTLKRSGLHSFTVSAPGYPTEFHTITWSDQ